MDLVPGGGVGGSFTKLWFELALTALALKLCALCIELSREDGDELMLDALRPVALKSLFFARAAGS
jgi:hypothetical protein